MRSVFRKNPVHILREYFLRVPCPQLLHEPRVLESHVAGRAHGVGFVEGRQVELAQEEICEGLHRREALYRYNHIRRRISYMN